MGEASTGESSYCGGEPLGENAWCHTAVDFDISPMDVRRVHAHVVPNEDGATSLILAGPNGPTLPGGLLADRMVAFNLDTAEASGYRLTGLSILGVDTSTSRLTPARVYADALGRHDYLAQSPVRTVCSGAPVVPSPARVAAHRPAGTTVSRPVYGFERCSRSLFSPIELAGEPVDAFFFGCREDYCLSIDANPPSEWSGNRADIPVVQKLAGLGCTAIDPGPVDIVVGHFWDLGAEQIVMLPRACEGETLDTLWSVVDAGGGQVAWGPEVPLGALTDLEVKILRVADIDVDGFDDLLLLGEEVIGVMFGGDGGLSEARILPVAPLVLPYFDDEQVWGAAVPLFPPNVRIAVGQLDETPDLELAVRVEGGVRIVSLDGTRSVSLDESASDFSLADVDADGIDDLALLFDSETRIRLYLSGSSYP